MGEVISVSGETIEFWRDQISYTDISSTLDKQLRGITTASALLATAVSTGLVHPPGTGLVHPPGTDLVYSPAP